MLRFVHRHQTRVLLALILIVLVFWMLALAVRPPAGVDAILGAAVFAGIFAIDLSWTQARR